VIDSWVVKSYEYRKRESPASRPPATPVTKDASANAHSLYKVVLMPAASAADSL